MEIAPLRGRPFGGRAFIVRKTLDVQKHSFVNKHISYISFTFYNSTSSKPDAMHLIGIIFIF